MNRQPSGSPIGGQFAEGRNPDGPDLVTSDETTVMDVKVTVNRKTGEVSVTTNGEWSGLGDFDSVWDQLNETAQEIVEGNQNEYIKPDAILLTPDQVSKFEDFVGEFADPDCQLDDDDLELLEEEAIEYLVANPPAKITEASLRLTAKKWSRETSSGDSKGSPLVEFSLNHGTVSALDSDDNEIFVSAKEVEGALYDRNDGQFAYLDLMDGRSVRLDPIDIESDYYEV